MPASNDEVQLSFDILGVAAGFISSPKSIRRLTFVSHAWMVAIECDIEARERLCAEERSRHRLFGLGTSIWRSYFRSCNLRRRPRVSLQRPKLELLQEAAKLLPLVSSIEVICSSIITDEQLVDLGNLSEVDAVVIGAIAQECWRLSSTGFEAFVAASRHHLRELALTFCTGIEPRSMAAIGSLKHLRKLSLTWMPPLDTTAVAAWQHLSESLEELVVSCNPREDAAGGFLSDGALSALASLSALKTFSVANDNALSGRGFANWGSSLPWLQEISLVGCNCLGDDGVEMLGNLPMLRKLVLNGCSNVKYTAFAKWNKTDRLDELCIQNAYRYVRHATVSETELEDDQTLSSLGRFSALKKVTLMYFSELTGSCFARWGSLKKLEEIHVGFCPQLVDDEINALGNLLSLRVVELNSCLRITGDAFLDWARLAALRVLIVRGCCKLRHDALSLLYGTLPQLQFVDADRCDEIKMSQFPRWTRPL